MGNRKLFITLIFFILFLIASSVHSEEDVPVKITILLATISSDESEQYSFNSIINNSIALELKLEGFRVIYSEDTGTDEELLQEAVLRKASYLIKSTYSTTEKALKISMTCFRGADGTKIFSISEKIKINLDLDFSIKEKFMEIITQIKQDIEANPTLVIYTPEEIEKVAALEEKEVETTAPDKNIVDETESQIKEPDIIIPPAVLKNYFIISAGFSPFLTTGKASNYFTYGLVPDLYLGYRLSRYYGYLDLGLYSSLNYFTADGLLISSENMLISMGPEIGFGLDVNSFLGIVFRLSTGGTVFMMNRNNEGYKYAVIPYGLGAAGVTMNINSWFGIVATTSYILYIENSMLITGFSPHMGVYFRM